MKENTPRMSQSIYSLSKHLPLPLSYFKKICITPLPSHYTCMTTSKQKMLPGESGGSINSILKVNRNFNLSAMCSGLERTKEDNALLIKDHGHV